MILLFPYKGQDEDWSWCLRHIAINLLEAGNCIHYSATFRGPHAWGGEGQRQMWAMIKLPWHAVCLWPCAADNGIGVLSVSHPFSYFCTTCSNATSLTLADQLSKISIFEAPLISFEKASKQGYLPYRYSRFQTRCMWSPGIWETCGILWRCQQHDISRRSKKETLESFHICQ